MSEAETAKPEDAAEAEYLRMYPDVANEIRHGRIPSARHHYDLHGRREGRVWAAAGAAAAAPKLMTAAPPPAGTRPAGVLTACACDAMILSEDMVFIEAWVDDRLTPVVGVELLDRETGNRFGGPAFRTRRVDVEEHLGCRNPAELGLWAIVPVKGSTEGLAIILVFANGTGVELQYGAVTRLGRREFFETLLAHYGQRNTLGNRTARSFAELRAKLGPALGEMHARLRPSRRIVSNARLGRQDTTPRLSLVCVLYGIPDYLYLLIAGFARHAPLEPFEFVFVLNSPELEEVALRDAELAAFVFGARIRVITLNQNCGFSHANNVGIAEAAAERILVINPDVFPRDDGAVAHLLALAGQDLGGSITGGKLYYADGSVMHDGMFFERDGQLSALCHAPVWTVEHFRKGFADRPDGPPRPVPAVSGALMLFDRGPFQALGGFDETYIYGHYEDADLCLRSRAAGGAVIFDPRLAFWHHEGRGSSKRPEHAGSGLYNRWLFSQRWGGKLEGANNV